MGNGSTWIAGPIVVGIIAAIAIGYSIYNCVRRHRMRQTLKTQVVNQQTVPFVGVPAPAGPVWNNSHGNQNVGFQGNFNNQNGMMGGGMGINMGQAVGMEMGMNMAGGLGMGNTGMGNAIDMGIRMNQGNQGFNYEQNVYDPLHPMQNNISMGLMANNF